MKKIYFLIIVAALLLPMRPMAQVTVPWMRTFDGFPADQPSYLFGMESLNDFYPFGAATAIDGCYGSMAMVFTGYMNNVVTLPEFNLPIDSLAVSFVTRPETGNVGVFEIGYLTIAYDSTSFVPVASYSTTDPEFIGSCDVNKYASFSAASDSAVQIAFRFRPLNTGQRWYIDNLQVFAENGCQAPDSTNIQNITSTSAELEVFLPSGGTAYVAFLNGVLLDTIVGNPYLIDSLEPSTDYTVTVYTLCGNEVGGQAVILNFATECLVAHVPYVNDFESEQLGALPSCWLAPLSGLNPPVVNTTTGYSYGDDIHGNSLFANSNDLIVLPALTVDLDGRDLRVSFMYVGAFPTTSVRVGLITDITDTTTFTEIAVFTQDSTDNYTYDLHSCYTYIDAMYLSDTVHVALICNGSARLDDFDVRMVPNTCRMPVASSISLNDDSIHLTWQSHPDVIYESYRVVYSTNYGWLTAAAYGLDVDTVLISVGTDTSAMINGLTPQTRYHFWVQPDCSDSTDWYYIGSVYAPCPSGVNAPYFMDFRTGYDNFARPFCWNVLIADPSSGRPLVYNRISEGDTLGALEFFNQVITGGQFNLITLPYIRLQPNNMMITMLADNDPLTQGLEVGYVTELPDLTGLTYFEADSVVSTIFHPLDTIFSEHPYLFDIPTTDVPPTEDTIWIAFRFSTRHAARIYYINVDEIPTCVRPAFVEIDTLGHNFADLTLVGANASSYEVLYSTVDNIDSATTSMTTSYTSFTITGLTPSTTYYTWVRSVCDTNVSEWRTGPSFTTKCGADACPLTIELIDPSSVISMAIFSGAGVNVYSDTTFMCKIEDPNTERNFYVETLWVCSDMAPINLVADAGSFAAFGGWFFPMYVNVTLSDSTVLNYDATLFPHGTTITSITNPCPSCSAVQSIEFTDVTTNQVTMTWTPADSSDNSWVVFLDTVAIDTVSDSASYTFTGLDGNTLYTFGVATNCSGSLATIITRDTVTVCPMYEPCPFRVQLIDRYGGGMFFNNHVQVWSNNYMAADVTSLLVTPDTIIEDVYVCSGDSVHVIWSGANNPVIDEAFALNIFNGNGVWMAGGNASLYSSNHNIVTFMPFCPCLAPDPISSVAGINSITVEWGNSDSTEVQISTDEYYTDPYTIVTNDQTVTFDGLNSSTVYYIRLRTLCSIGGRISEWGELVDTTLYDSTIVIPDLPCPAPTGLALIATTYTNATIGWHPGGAETQWELAITVQGAPRQYFTTDTVFVIDSLYPEYTIHASVRAICGEGYEEGVWSDTIMFITDVCEPIPTAGVGIGDITEHSATVSWPDMEGSFGYVLYYGIADFQAPEASTATLPQETTHYTMEELEAETDYELFILNKCTESINSAPTSRIQFSTLAETGITTVDPSALTLSPNPASGMVTLRMAGFEEPYAVEVIDMKGRTVRATTAEGGTCTIDVSSMAQGTYFVRVTGDQFTAVKKLIVK